MIIGALSESQTARRVPKYGLSLKETIFSIGSDAAVKEMRALGMLSPVSTNPLLFDAGNVARAWVDWKERAANQN